MPEQPPPRAPALREVLLGYLQAATGVAWPGADALTVRDILLSYPQAAAAGRVPSRQELLRLYPELSEDVEAFFAGQEAAIQDSGTN